MIKLIGALLVIVSFGVIGIMLGKNVKRHGEELRQIQFGLQVLETEIMYGQTPLPKALEIVSQQTKGVVARFFNNVSQELLNGLGETAGEAWSKALEKMQPYSTLTSEDLNFLEQFGQGLGFSDREDQLKRLTGVKIQLATREKDAEIERSRFQKIWQTLGWACGLMITLLFI